MVHVHKLPPSPGKEDELGRADHWEHSRMAHAQTCCQKSGLGAGLEVSTAG